MEEEVVELVLVAEVGPELGADGGDGCGVEAAGRFGKTGGDVAAGADGAGAAGGGVLGVEEGVGHGVDELMREDGWDGGVDSDAGDGACGDSLQHFEEAFEVHGLGEGVLHDLADEGVVGDLDVAGHGLGTGGGVGEDAGQEVVGAGALDLGGDAFALGHAQELEAAAGGPAPAVLEEGRGDAGLLEELAGGEGGEEVEDVGQREAVLLGEGDVDAVVGGGGLELEVEAAAEALAEGKAPGLVQAAAEGGVEDELLASSFVEEALGDEGGFGGDGAEDGAAVDDVGDELESCGVVEEALALEEGEGVGDFEVLRSIGFLCASIPRLRGETWGTQICGGEIAGAEVDLVAEVADAVREDRGALGGFAFPEGDAGWGAVGVFDEDLAGGVDALDAPAGVAEEDDVAGRGVDGEVLVEGGDLDVLGLKHDGEDGGVGDGSAVRDGDAAGAAAGVEMALDAVAEDVGAVAAAGVLDAVVEEGEDLAVLLAGEVAVRPGAAEDVVEGVFVPGLGADGGDDLLHEDVDGLLGDLEEVEFAGGHLAQEGGLFEEVVAGGGEESALGDGAAPVAGAAYALHGYGDRSGRRDLADEVDRADVDAEFERGGGDEDLALAGLEALLGV